MRIIKILTLLITFSGITSTVNWAGTLSAEVDRYVYEQWIEIVKNVHSEHRGEEVHMYTVLAENFYRKYRETSNPAYLNFALHEAGRILRVEIIDSLTEEELAHISDVLQKMHYRNIPSGYYRIRDFGPSDIYTFIGSDIPEEMDGDAHSSSVSDSLNSPSRKRSMVSLKELLFFILLLYG